MRYLCIVAFAMAGLSANADDYDFEVDGIRYLIESLTELTVKVSGFSDSTVSELSLPETVEYKSKILTVKSIGDGAFKALDSLESVSLPNSVESIGANAFQFCS